MTPKRNIRVLIVDDSASVRETLVRIISDHPALEVMGTAADPFRASEILKREKPDVITLDVEMPRMDGVTFLRRLMAQHPMPVVVCSSLVGDGTATLESVLAAGAVDIIQKPSLGVRDALLDQKIMIQNAVLGAAQARTERLGRGASHRSKASADAVLPAPTGRAMAKTTETVIAIGASTGGTDALRLVLERLSPFSPPIVIVQHMPESFTAAFAKRLDSSCAITVKEAANGDTLLRGQALIAPGNRHMLLRRSGATYCVEVRDGPLVNRHRPSVDVLFRSVAQYAGPNASGFILTGMGDDGAKGLLEMRNAGAHTFGQNEESCVVYGMPAEAKKIGAVSRELDLDGIANTINRIAGQSGG
ncbi:protein-glutamate methylesterase/protein-glutamine glutaminase [Aestuariivita boseongensis]|uniref:protein-glutamate methylesterase/protein-glutamine glutaminase n=1 Tax=Aestuariivita boseongensis TaxID=1470562 RepID=UPI0006804E42|nr:chemotaxis response regulator protein-glutamate methylesterase [Aestuariivita boseongensis]